MVNGLEKRVTRFRAYKLGTEGSAFSYFDGSNFTLIEARLTDVNRPNLAKELKICGVKEINCLHITSWDADHCSENDLKEILKLLKPNKVEYPGYAPHTDTAKGCLKIIEEYKKQNSKKRIQCINPLYIKSLDTAEKLGYQDVFYHPKFISKESNNNSTVKLFRTGSFNVASLGDVDTVKVSSKLKASTIFKTEVDVMILAHHGADNGFTTSGFLKHVRPKIAICSADYDDKFEHPKKEIRNLLIRNNIPIYTTKIGDVIVESIAPHTSVYQVTNLQSDSKEISSTSPQYESKKNVKLKHNKDTIRNIYQGKGKPFWKKRK